MTQIKLSLRGMAKLEAMTPRATMRRQIALLAALFFFAQLALAAQGCSLATGGWANGHDDATMSPPCANLPMDRSACFTHCVTQEQSAAAPDQHFTAIVASPAARPLDFRLSAQREPARTLCDSRLHVPRARQILYCSYLA